MAGLSILRQSFAALLAAGAIAATAMTSPVLASEDLQLAMDDARHGLETVFSVTLTDSERAWYQAALFRVHRDDPETLEYNVKWLRDAAAHITSPDLSLPYVGEERREQYSAAYHCGLAQSDEPDPKELLRILDGHNPVITADCERSLVIRKRDLDAWFASANFVAEQAGLAPLSSKEIADINAHLRKLPDSLGAGPVRYASNWHAIRHWWSTMPEDFRERNVAAIAGAVTSREAITPEVEKLVGKSRHESRNLALCTTAKRMVIRQAALLHEQTNSVSDALNGSGVDSGYDIGAQSMGIAEPTLKRLCGDVWE